MMSRTVWAAFVLGSMLAIGCGGKKDEPPPSFVRQEDGRLMIRVQNADGTVFFIEPKTIWIKQSDGSLARQPEGCPTCEACDCRRPACNPFCM